MPHLFLFTGQDGKAGAGPADEVLAIAEFSLENYPATDDDDLAEAEKWAANGVRSIMLTKGKVLEQAIPCRDEVAVLVRRINGWES